MTELKVVWAKLKASKIGWSILVSFFAVSFFLLVSIVSGILSIPWIVDEVADNGDVVMGLVFPALILGFSVLFAKYFSKNRGVSWQKLLGWRKPKKNAIWLIPLAILGYVVLVVAVLATLQALNPQLAGQEQEVANTVSSMSGMKLGIMVFSVGFLTPIAEETFFRGLLTSLYARKLKIIFAIIFSSALFGLAHGQLNVGLDTFVFGLILGCLTYKTESIYPAISLHMLKNGLALFAILHR